MAVHMKNSVSEPTRQESHMIQIYKEYDGI